MEVTYDAEADAMYICVDRREFHSTAKAKSILSPYGDVVFDTWDGKPHGIEVLGASKHPIFSQLIPRMEGGTLTSSEVSYD